MSAVGLPEYQETAAGWIPADWSPLPLGAVASVRKDKGVAKQGVPCVELEHVEQETGRLLGWDSSGAQASIKTAFKRGDVLFGKLRPYLRKYAIAPFDGICTTEILAIHPRDGQSDNQFLFHLMQGDGVFATVEALSYGTKMPRVSWTDLSGIVLGIPPLPEQQIIAAILTAVDDKLDVIARQIEATQTLKKGLMQTLFSRGVGTQDADSRWVPHAEFKDSELGEIPAGWECLKLGDVLAEKPEYGANASAVPFDAENQIRYLRITDIDEHGQLRSDSIKAIPSDEAKEYLLVDGDLLIARSGNTVGKSILYKSTMGLCAFAGYLLRFRFGRKVLVEFVAEYLTSDTFWAWVKASVKVGAQPNINAQQYQAMFIPVPPPEEQQRIAAVLAGVDEKVELLRARQTQFQSLKRGLMQKLLTGEWRVKVDARATGT